MHLFVIGDTLNDRQNDRLIFLILQLARWSFQFCYRSAFFTSAFYPSFRSIFPHATFRILHVRDFPHFTGVHLPLVVCSNADAASHRGVVMGVAYRHMIWPGMKWKYAAGPGRI